MSEHAEKPTASVLIVERGAPSDAELAALVAVLASAGGPAPAPSAPRSLWADPALQLGLSSMPSSAAWTSAVRSR
ncbi:MAG: acyl-CoA carboxylase epsilon subunit [Mycobacteriaceae bacterium]